MTIDEELGELDIPSTPEEALLPASGHHARALAGATDGTEFPLYDDEALTNIWRPADSALGIPPQGPANPGTEAPYVPGAGSPAVGHALEPTVLEPSDVHHGTPPKPPELLVRHIVETTKKGSSDFRIFRVPVGPQANAAPGAGVTASPVATTILDANPQRNRALIRNVSTAAVSIFLVRAGTGGNAAYLQLGYRLQQNGETIEIDSTAPLEAYCQNFGDVGLLQIIEEFTANDDGSLGAPE